MLYLFKSENNMVSLGESLVPVLTIHLASEFEFYSYIWYCDGKHISFSILRNRIPIAQSIYIQLINILAYCRYIFLRNHFKKAFFLFRKMIQITLVIIWRERKPWHTICLDLNKADIFFIKCFSLAVIFFEI